MAHEIMKEIGGIVKQGGKRLAGDTSDDGGRKVADIPGKFMRAIKRGQKPQRDKPVFKYNGPTKSV